MWDAIQFILALLLMFGLPGIFAYFLLFKAQHSNFPLASRGIGIVVVAGMLKVAAVILSEHGLRLEDESYLNYGLGAFAGIGLLMMMAGFGGGPTYRTNSPPPTRRRRR